MDLGIVAHCDAGVMGGGKIKDVGVEEGNDVSVIMMSNTSSHIKIIRIKKTQHPAQAQTESISEGLMPGSMHISQDLPSYLLAFL